MKKIAALALLGGLGLVVRAEESIWTGPSAGVTLGAVRHTASWAGNSSDGDRPSGNTLNTGFLPGVHLGYDWLRGTTVMGVELSHAFGTSTKDSTTGSSAYPVQRADRLKSLSGLTFRWGLPQGDNLYYVRGGVGLVRADHTFTPTQAAQDAFTASNQKGGLLLGIGFERRIADSLAFRAEYTRFQGASESYTWASTGQTYRTQEKLDIFKAGLSWRF